jgi:hypothetical protein
MNGRIPARRARLAAALLAAVAALGLTAEAASAAEVIYNNIPKPTPKNLPSVSFEATSTSEFGGELEFAGTARTNPKVTVLMSSWGCQSGSWFAHDCVTTPGATFDWPIAVNVYSVGPGNSLGAKIAAGSKTFEMPYRPSASPKCTGAQAGEWYSERGKRSSCFNGLAFKIALPLKVASLPSKAIVTVSYNTSDYGAEPQRPKPCDSESQGCPYDSLNVAINASYKYNAETEKYETEPVPPPSVGATPLPEEVFINSNWNAVYCGNQGAVDSLGPSGACWRYEQPAIEVKAG